MKYKKNKLRLIEIASAIQGFYFLVKFGLVLIYRLKVYRKKYSSILLRKNMINFSFEKYVPSQVFNGFSVENLETTPSNFLSKFFSWDIISNVRSVQFGLCCNRIFFSFFFFVFFYSYFPWQTLTIHRIAGIGEGIIVFLVFHFHPLKNIHVVHRDFYHFFLINLFVITRLIAYETSSPNKFAFYLHFHCCN